MFTIIISEKGGAERRESFDKNEINVGRVQGNDLMLPKGNVSKHHARLLYRDGRFIVTDLKSTNGTYVNGRKIAQATIVREGDKIYIGDFVVRLDTGGVSSVIEPESSRHDDAAVPRPRAEVPSRGVPPQLAVRGDAGVSHYPLERDPDESEATGAVPQAVEGRMPARLGSSTNEQRHDLAPRVPPAPRVPSQLGVSPTAASGLPVPLPRHPAAASTALMGGAAAPQRAVPVPAQGSARSPSASGSGAPVRRVVPIPADTAENGALPHAAPAGAAASLEPARAQASRVPPPKETPHQAARRLALTALVDRVAEALDLGPLKSSPILDEAFLASVERAAREQALAMTAEGEVPEGVEMDLVSRDAHRELVALGPLGPLLDDDEVTEIHCTRYDQVLVSRAGSVVLAETPFTSDAALHRVIARLVHGTGRPWQERETLVERRLAGGAQMIAIAPPLGTAHALTIRKRRRVEGSLEDVIRAGGLSRPMAVFLEHCIAARANVLLIAPDAHLASTFLVGLAALAPPADRVGLVQDNDDLAMVQPFTIALSVPDDRQRASEILSATVRLGLDRLFVSKTSGPIVAALVETVCEGAEGVVACLCAPTLRQGLARLVGHVTLARPGLPVESARECVGESFDIAVELGRAPEGRTRIVRIAELAGADSKGVVARDVFALTESAGAEPSYAATGVVPRFASEFAARGVRVDVNLFKRTLNRN